MFSLNNFYLQAKAELESFAQARKNDVARGAETAELAGLLTQKYGYGLAKGLQLVAELSDHPAVSLMGDVDRCVAEIDPHWRTTFDRRIKARPAALDLPPQPADSD